MHRVRVRTHLVQVGDLGLDDLNFLLPRLEVLSNSTRNNVSQSRLIPTATWNKCTVARGWEQMVSLLFATSGEPAGKGGSSGACSWWLWWGDEEERGDRGTSGGGLASTLLKVSSPSSSSSPTGTTTLATNMSCWTELVKF